MLYLRLVGWRLRTVSGVLEILKKMAGRVKGRVLGGRKCIWDRWSDFMKIFSFLGFFSSIGQ